MELPHSHNASQSVSQSVSQSASAFFTDDEIAAMIAGVLDGALEVPPGVSKEDAVSALLQELPDAPPPEVADAVAKLVKIDAEERDLSHD